MVPISASPSCPGGPIGPSHEIIKTEANSRIMDEIFFMALIFNCLYKIMFGVKQD
jgi:hypothetical protein